MNGLKIIASGAVLFALSILAPGHAYADVNPQKGNYQVKFADLTVTGGINPKVERIYDSRTSFKGMFGWGWGSNLETYLTLTADGRVVLHEHGCGKESVFAPEDFGEEHVTAAVNTIVAASSVSGDIMADQQKQYAMQLHGDADFRDREWERLKAKGRIQDKPIADGVRLVSGYCGGYQYLTRITNGFIRTDNNGTVETFDNGGRLKRVTETNGRFLALNRDKQGRLTGVSDNLGRRLLFRLNAEGLVTAIEDGKGREAEYRYNDKSELIYSKSADKDQVLAYHYDDQHKLVEILHTDGTALRIAYEERDKGDKVKSVTNRDGEITEYLYETDPVDMNHLIVKVKILRDGAEPSNDQYEYFMARHDDGSEWVQRKIETRYGWITETIFNACCNQPVSITRDSETVSFEYDEKGRVIKKIWPSSTMVIAYDESVGKIRSVAEYLQENKDIRWSEFEYNSKGNVTLATNSDGSKIALGYDKVGNIVKIKNLRDSTVLDVKYGSNGKPIVISVANVGTITTKYDARGEIIDVKSNGGSKTAIKVMTTFQQLLQVIKPASISLTFLSDNNDS